MVMSMQVHTLPSCRCWESNLALLEDHPVLLNSEPSPQPPLSIFPNEAHAAYEYDMYVYIYVHVAGYSLVLQCLPSMHKTPNMATSNTVYTYRCSICTLYVYTYTHTHIYLCIRVGFKLFSQAILLFLLVSLTSIFCFQNLIAWKRREEGKSKGICNWLCCYEQKMAVL